MGQVHNYYMYYTSLLVSGESLLQQLLKSVGQWGKSITTTIKVCWLVGQVHNYYMYYTSLLVSGASLLQLL